MLNTCNINQLYPTKEVLKYVALIFKHTLQKTNNDHQTEQKYIVLSDENCDFFCQGLQTMKTLYNCNIYIYMCVCVCT